MTQGNYVYVVNAQERGRAARHQDRQVDDSGVTIVEGLTGQEAVVLSAGPFLNPGQKVSPEAAGRALTASDKKLKA